MARTAKTVRKTHSESYLVNKKYYGDEPTFERGHDRIKLLNGFNWYNTMAEEDDVRKYIVDFYKSVGQSHEITKISRVPFMRIPRTAASVFRMHMRGATLDDGMLERAKQSVAECMKYAEVEKKEEPTNVVRLSIQDHVNNKVSDFIADIDETIDNLPADFSMYKILQSAQFPANLSVRVADRYRPIMQEISDAIEKKDPQLVEGYSRYTKKQMKDMLALYTGIVEDCEKYSGNLRKARMPRKKKAVSAEKKLKNFQYQKEDNSLKISSVNPETILGAQELWTFNTKSKVLSVFRAVDRGGLSVKSTAITGYDPASSQSKKIGRKTDEILNSVTTSGKVALRKLFDTINTDNLKFVDRLNSNTVLLKVVK